MSDRVLDTGHSIPRWMRTMLLGIFVMIMALPVIPPAVSAQAYGPPGGGGYGMMGGGRMMGNRGPEAEQQLSLSESMRFLGQSAGSARVEKAGNRVIFTGGRVFIAAAAVQPGFPDTTFEVAGLVDPTIEVPAGAVVTLLLINMDYGPAMDHGVVITGRPPPYPALGMMGTSRTLAGVPVLPPRDQSDGKTAHYAADSVTFTAPASGGTYYYLCQYRDHASEGMYGRFEVRQAIGGG